MPIPVRVASAALLAGLCLPGSSHAQVQRALQAEVARPAADVRAIALERRVAPPESAASATERAQQLETQASRLVAEADDLQARAEAMRRGAAGKTVAEPVYADLLRTADARRAQAKALADEAARLRQFARDEVARLHDEKTAALAGRDTAPGIALQRPGQQARPPVMLRGDEVGVPAKAALESHEPALAAAPAPAPAPAPPPPDQPQPTSAQDTSSPAAAFAAEAAQIDQLVTGSAGVSAPASAKVGVPFTVFLRVSPEKLQVVLQSLKNDFPGNQTLKGKEGIKLAPTMTATVSGFGFDVSPKDGQTQAVSPTEATTWQWQIQPSESGLLTLSFALSGTLSVQGKEVPRTLYEYQQTVQVAVSPMSFVQQYWQWLVTTLALPAIAAAWAFFRKPRDGAGGRQPSLAEKLRDKRR